MNKIDVQKRISQNGSMLPLDKFQWDKYTKTLITTENDLRIDFENIDNWKLLYF